MTDYYRVALADGHDGCERCGSNRMWTVISGEGDDAIEIGTSWGDQELAEDVCDLMNMAFREGVEFEENAASASEGRT